MFKGTFVVGLTDVLGWGPLTQACVDSESNVLVSIEEKRAQVSVGKWNIMTKEERQNI